VQAQENCKKSEETEEEVPLHRLYEEPRCPGRWHEQAAAK